jgi:transcriptional regulator with GAF, ATPase, and Fis domain
MEHNQRHKRLRLLIARLNKERKKQAQKIDILCNDLIATQREFIKRLDTISFTANFYETIVGTTNLSSLIATAARIVNNQVPDASVAFFLRHENSFELHMFESDHPITLEKERLENCFTPELVDNICKSNKVCTLDDMFAMGLQGNPVAFNEISAVTIPLGQPGRSLGFILVYRPSQNRLTAQELNNISAITSGLSRAVASCRVPSH